MCVGHLGSRCNTAPGRDGRRKTSRDLGDADNSNRLRRSRDGGTPQALKTPGEGVWRHTIDNDYAFRFKFFTFNAQNVFTGWTIIAGETTVDETGDANVGSATVEVYNPNGVLVATACAETAGTRFGL